jgi:hypothetical protein
MARKLNPNSDLFFPGRRPRNPLSDMTFTKLLRKIGVFLYRDRRNVKKFREMGLGAFPAVSLAPARKKTADARKLNC